jgi:ATP-dependent 26S proteasome regulatory subunit
VAEAQPIESGKTQQPVSEHPAFIQTFFDSYRAKEAHVFIMHGNVNDFPNNSGRRGDIRRALALSCDTPSMLAECKDDAQKQDVAKVQRILAYYTMANGLEFASPESNNLWRQIMKQYLKDIMPGTAENDLETQVKELEKPINFEMLLNTMNFWFTASKKLHQHNQKIEVQKKGTKLPDPLFTIVFFDGDALFPAGVMSQLNMDRSPIVNVRNWARDEALGNKNRVIIITRHLSDIHESIRGGESGVRAILIPKPIMKDREEWLNNFDLSLQERAKKGTPQKLGGKEVTHIEYAPGFDAHLFAIQSAGLSRKQMENIFMRAALDHEPIDFPLVRALKTKALEEEYGGLVDFREPEHGFDKVGGHEHLKRYFQRKIITPLKKGDKRTCSRGVLLTGPPGTGKTAITLAMAKEAGVNFMIAHLARLFGGLVGETENNTQKFIEAADSAAPVIVFIDELDSVLSAGRSSVGDSGTSSRVFNSIMTWLSDESRSGRIVVVGATNRPDLLDSALIRSGRFDAILPCLPPQKGDAKGRLEILQALTKKQGFKFAKELQDTLQSKDTGIGKLLHDQRIWTGAEMEVVLKEAIDNACFENRTAVGLKDWNQALADVLPSTREVEKMIDLSLLFVNHLGYCPEDWKERAQQKGEILTSIKTGYDETSGAEAREV